MRTTLALALALSLAGCCAPCCPRPVPVATPAVVAATPAPTPPAPPADPYEKHGFSVDLVVYVGGVQAGTGSFSATHAKPDGDAAWETSQSLALGPDGEGQMTTRMTESLTRDLAILKATRANKGPYEVEESTVERKGKTLVSTSKKGDAAPESKTVEAAEEVFSTSPTATLLLLKRVPKDAATRSVRTWDADPGTVVTRTLVVKGPVRLKEESLGLDLDAVRADASGGKVSTEVYVTPDDRSFLAMRVVEPGVWIVRKGLAVAPTAVAVPDMRKPANSARAVGGRFAMGILVGDLEAIADSFDWEALAADAAEKAGQPVPAELVKTITLEQLKANLKSMQAEAAWAVVRGALEKAEEKPEEGGAVFVRLGPPFQKVAYTAKATGGIWRIVRMSAP